MKEIIEKDIEAVKAALDKLKQDIEAAGEAEKAELKEKIAAALADYSDELQQLSELNATLKNKLGKYGRAFLYACIGILAIAGVDKLVEYIKSLF